MRSGSPTPTRHATEEVHLPVGTDVDVVVVADTHGHPHPGARALIERLAPPVILHAGDIGDLSVLAGLGQLAPVLAVRGNIDGHAASLPDSMTIDFVVARQRVLRAHLTHIAVYGPRLRAEVARLARAHAADLVICGHSHVPFIGRDKGRDAVPAGCGSDPLRGGHVGGRPRAPASGEAALTVFNPGSLGPRRFHLPIVFGVLRLGPSGISMRHVSCETGETWLP